jgi:magnesium transporter
MFEGVVAKLSVAVVFQSLVLDMAGNVGTQSLAVSIRVLADPDLTIKERMFLIFKETRTGFANGLVIGSGSALVLGIFVHYAFGYSWINAYAIALCVGLAMLVSMVISSLSGTAIPALFQRLGIDPAAASGPLITTLNDLIGVTTYYSLVWVLLIQMLKL